MLQWKGFEVETTASPEVVWKAFSDVSRWPRFDPEMTTARWAEGQPWQKGSRYLLELTRTEARRIEGVIIRCEPAVMVEWISHAIGLTLQRRVDFIAKEGGGTIIRTTAEHFGEPSVPLPDGIEGLLLRVNLPWFEALARYCDSLATQTESANPAPGP